MPLRLLSAQGLVHSGRLINAGQVREHDGTPGFLCTLLIWVAPLPSEGKSAFTIRGLEQAQRSHLQARSCSLSPAGHAQRPARVLSETHWPSSWPEPLCIPQSPAYNQLPLFPPLCLHPRMHHALSLAVSGSAPLTAAAISAPLHPSMPHVFAPLHPSKLCAARCTPFAASCGSPRPPSPTAAAISASLHPSMQHVPSRLHPQPFPPPWFPVHPAPPSGL